VKPPANWLQSDGQGCAARRRAAAHPTHAMGMSGFSPLQMDAHAATTVMTHSGTRDPRQDAAKADTQWRLVPSPITAQPLQAMMVMRLTSGKSSPRDLIRGFCLKSANREAIGASPKVTAARNFEADAVVCTRLGPQLLAQLRCRSRMVAATPESGTSSV
jgi:hypothetical protein